MFTRIFGLGITSAAALTRFEFIISLTMKIALTKLNSEQSGTLIAFREIAAEAPSIVRYCQNSIGYFLAFDVRLEVFDSHVLCNASAISLSASIVGPRTTRKDVAPARTQKKCTER